MAPENQDTATDIELRITRHGKPAERGSVLPEPLADPLQDIRIRASTASAYVVKAGEYIQVIDVSGRQCTDFQALSARKVDKGLDLALDSTVTRTLLGRSYPAPGLPSKSFDREFEPLVEIVQDTVGRHDAFALPAPHAITMTWAIRACELHRNFNNALAPYGVAPPQRAGKR
jgi:aminomethyltransferase